MTVDSWQFCAIVGGWIFVACTWGFALQIWWTATTEPSPWTFATSIPVQACFVSIPCVSKQDERWDLAFEQNLWGRDCTPETDMNDFTVDYFDRFPRRRLRVRVVFDGIFWPPHAPFATDCSYAWEWTQVNPHFLACGDPVVIAEPSASTPTNFSGFRKSCTGRSILTAVSSDPLANTECIHVGARHSPVPPHCVFSVNGVFAARARIFVRSTG